MQVNYSSTNPADYLAILKYATCVKECPTNTSAVKCKQPNNFNIWAPGYFVDCVYYPLGTNNYKNYSFRYDTAEGKRTICD